MANQIATHPMNIIRLDSERGVKRLIRKLCCSALFIVSFYFLGSAITMHYFLSSIVFKEIEQVPTNESLLHIVEVDGDELFIRQYGNTSIVRCAIFFPGQHGGIRRYEHEIFKEVLENDISVFALSYPGYEGAKGSATFESIKSTTFKALEFINDNTGCKIRNAVFIGRSLGASIALASATTFKPKGLLLDSISPSLAIVIREKLTKNIFLRTLNILPIEDIVEFDMYIDNQFINLSDVPIVIFQGDLDTLTPYDRVHEAVIDYNNIQLIRVLNGTHRNTHILAGQMYIDKLKNLVFANFPNRAE